VAYRAHFESIHYRLRQYRQSRQLATGRAGLLCIHGKRKITAVHTCAATAFEVTRVVRSRVGLDLL